MLASQRMDTPQEPTPERAYTDGRAISGKIFVVVFLAISVTLAGIVTVTRVNVRPKYEAAVATSSAKAAAVDAQRFAPSASAKPQETPK